MFVPIEFTHDKVIFHLQNLKGTILFHKFIDFSEPTPFVRLAQLENSDPSRCRGDLEELSKIHRTLQTCTDEMGGTETEKIAMRYWLASLFLLYFRIYHLDLEGSLCRLAWVHLLRLRWSSLLALYPGGKPGGEETESAKPGREDWRKQGPGVLREWRTFIQDPHNHFLFQKGYGLDSPEEEMEKIISGQDSYRKEPHPFFLEEPGGRDVLRRRFISEWLLNDRYDWWKAFRLCCYYWGVRPKPVSVVLGVLLIALVSLLGAGYFRAFQGALLILAAAAICISFRSESVIELLVPRLWAAVAVGYVPMLVTKEIWEASIRILWPGVVVFWVFSFILSWLYLRWEIGNRLRQTPELKHRVSMCRALFLFIIGTLITLVAGLFILDFVGKPFIDIYLENYKTQLGQEWSVQGLFSTIYPKMLLTFAPVALLLGVVLQIFWQERAVTAPV